VQNSYRVSGAGLGLRRTHLGSLLSDIPASIEFLEAAPENWLDVGGRLGEAFAEITRRRPLVCHGLLLNLGGPDPLNESFLRRLKAFLESHNVLLYGDHLSYCAEQGHLYELLPIPFTEEAIIHVAARIRQVQDQLGRRIAVENASYYLTLSNDLDEVTFIRAVLEEADCELLLDINNIYVNSVNHQYDPAEFIASLPAERIAYAHIAGHTHTADDLIVDTHGEDVIDPVWHLLGLAYQRFGVFPTLLERDLDIPPLEATLLELEQIRQLQLHAQNTGHAAA